MNEMFLVVALDDPIISFTDTFSLFSPLMKNHSESNDLCLCSHLKKPTKFSVFQVTHEKENLSSQYPYVNIKPFLYTYRSDESVLITENFHPKRQLLSSKTKDSTSNLEETNAEKSKIRRRKKPIEDFTDPIVIVQSYDRGLYKPNVGWQFRYRVSRYIDSLRENIREDQKRLQKGLQDIQGKKSQELTGRRKRPTDKPLPSETEQLKKRDERKSEEKRQTSSGQKKKSASHRKSHLEVEEEYIEGEKDLDPELRKINEEGRRVGWTYRYRIRRKLDHLKQIQSGTV